MNATPSRGEMSLADARAFIAEHRTIADDERRDALGTLGFNLLGRPPEGVPIYMVFDGANASVADIHLLEEQVLRFRERIRINDCLLEEKENRVYRVWHPQETAYCDPFTDFMLLPEAVDFMLRYRYPLQI